MRVSISNIAGSNVINEEESHQDWKEVEVQEIPKVSNLRLYGDVEQIRGSILFYALQLFQNVCVIIYKLTYEQNDKSSQSSSSQSYHSNQTRSIANIFVIMTVAGMLVFMIFLYKKQRLKKQLYFLQTYADLAVLGGLASYILSKASAKDSIFFMRDDSIASNCSRGLEMYDLYYLQLLSDKLFHRKSPLISLLAKCCFHILILVFYLPNTSIIGYVPLITCAIQFVACDLLKVLTMYNKMESNLSDTEIMQEINENYEVNDEEDQQLQSRFRNDSNLHNIPGHNSLSNSHQTEGILVGLDHSAFPRPTKFSMSMSSKGLFEGNKNLQGIFDDPLKHKKMKKLLVSQREQDEKWKQYLNQIPLGVLLVKKSLDQIQFANDFIKQFFLRNFRKFSDKDILEAVMRQFKFKILSHVVNHSSNEKKRIAKFSLSAKKQVRESFSNNADKKQQQKRTSNSTNTNNLNSVNTNQLTPSNNVESKPNSTTNLTHFQFSVKTNNEEIAGGGSFKSPLLFPVSETQSIPEQPTMTLEQIILNFDKTISSMSQLGDSTLEIYAKTVNFDNNESISLKGKVLYRAEGDEYLIIIEDITKYEHVTSLADRDDYKNRLISSFSHELRTPLNSSMGFLQTAILDSAIQQNVKDTFLIPAYQSLRLQFFFINDILDFSQILAKRDLQLNFVTFHIQKLVQDLKDLYDNSFEAKGISLQFVFDQKIKTQEICTDYDRLMQILVNLLNNSLRYTLKGGVTLRINTTRSNNLIFNVEDTGEGMKRETFEQVKLKLQNFDQTGSAISESQHTGFGLTISQIIVSILATEENSDLQLKNTEGGGCTFSFSIENIMNLQTSYSLTSYSTIKVDMIKTGVKVNRNGIKKHTYAPRNLERVVSTKGPQLSSHSLNTRDNKRKNNTVVVSNRPEELTKNVLIPQNSKASSFKKSQQMIGKGDDLVLENSPMFPFQQKQQLIKLTPHEFFNDPQIHSPVLSIMDKKEENNEEIFDIFTNVATDKVTIPNQTQTHETDQTNINTQHTGQVVVSTHHKNPKHDISKLNLKEAIQGKNKIINEDLLTSNTYSQQKKFFATQSQALLYANHKNYHVQKSQKTFDMFNLDQDESFLLHEDESVSSQMRDKLSKNYNFNYLLNQKEAQHYFKGTDRSSQPQNVSFDNTDRHSQEHYSFFKSQNLHHVPIIQQAFKTATGDNSGNLLKKMTPSKQPNIVKFRFPRWASSLVENNNNNINNNNNHQETQEQTQIFNTFNGQNSSKNNNNEKDNRITETKSNNLNVKFDSEVAELSILQRNNSAKPKQSIDSLHVFEDNKESKELRFQQPEQYKNVPSGISQQLIGSSQKQIQPQANILSSNNPNTPNKNHSFFTPNNVKNNELINNIIFNQMQLSEQYSEFSWQNNNNNSQINNNNAIDPSANQKCTSQPASQRNINNNNNNNNQYFSNEKKSNQFLNKMQIDQNFQQDQQCQALLGDLEAATTAGTKELSFVSYHRPKLSRNSSWVRKNSLQFVEKEEKESIEPEDLPHQKSQLLEPVNAPPLQQLLQKCQCKRILCVDDEVFNLQVLFLLFKKLGYSIEKAFNGKDAIQVFTQFYSERQKYQCESPNCTVFKAVILDCNMPVMNGWECAKQLRNLMSQKKLPSIPIIALTAYVTQQAHNQCKESGMDEVINKPVSIELLRDTVEQQILIYESDQKPTWV